jgi:hypothetical protein
VASTITNLAANLTASVNASLTVASYAADPDGYQLNITYNTAGTTGNSYGLVASAATVSAATLTGGTTTGIGYFTISNFGTFTQNPQGGAFTQASTS